MPTYRTPSVHVEEISVTPTSVTEVETAIPAFVGYTQKAVGKVAHDLILQPTKIHSLQEYERLFGLPAEDTIALTVKDAPGGGFSVTAFTEPKLRYLLYFSVRMLFDNGGSQCCIVSVGTYRAKPVINLRGGKNGTSPVETRYGLRDGLDALAKAEEPTLIVIPEAVCLPARSYASLVQAALAQCGKLQDRFAILDAHGGAASLNDADLSRVRGHFGTDHLQYGAAYYPFLKTTLNHYVNDGESNVLVTYGNTTAPLGTFATRNKALHQFVRAALNTHYVTLPPSGAVAGVYAATDAHQGVWKAPANVALADVIEPTVKLDDARQGDLNVDAASGKSINAIRSFAGKGTVVWGARTLAGNDNEWRYIPVRRFFIMVEESVRKSTQWAVFEPNDANTWARLRAMIDNYLTLKWREGALQGTTAKDAFFVRCGLGTTMTALDVSEGRINIEIGMAAVRPGEFIILKVSLKAAAPSN